MKIFEIENNYPSIIPEHLFIPEFKKIWDRDKSKTKDTAKTELAYIYFKLSPKSPYLAYPLEEIDEKINQDLFKNKSFKPDKDLQLAIDKYNELSETPTSGLLKDARKSINEIRQFLRTVDLTERNRANMPVYKASEVTKTLAELNKVVDSLSKLEEQVSKEEISFDKTRGNVTGGALEFAD